MGWFGMTYHPIFVYLFEYAFKFYLLHFLVELIYNHACIWYPGTTVERCRPLYVSDRISDCVVFQFLVYYLESIYYLVCYSVYRLLWWEANQQPNHTTLRETPQLRWLSACFHPLYKNQPLRKSQYPSFNCKTDRIIFIQN